MGLADEFTAEMARFVTENPETDAIIQDLTCQNAFVTRLPDSQRYRFHHMMKECALRKFRTLPEQSQICYWNRFGSWYGAQGQYLHALGAYGRSGNSDAALTIIEKDAGNLLSALHPEELLERLNACPEEVLTRHPTAILVLMRRLLPGGRFRRCCSSRRFWSGQLRKAPICRRKNAGIYLASATSS